MDVTLVAKGTGSTYIKTGGNTAFKIDGVYGAGSGAATAVNYWNPSGSASGNGLRMDIGGSDTDVSMFFIAKGAGSIFFNSGGSSGTTQFKVSPTASADRYAQASGGQAGVSAPGGSSAAHADEDTPVPAAKPAPAASSSFDDEDDAPAVASAPVEAKPATQKAEDILAMIRARQKQ